MKRSWILSGLISLVLASSAIAEPSYDSKAWQSFMEGKSTVMPSGLPTGKGAVGIWNGRDFWLRQDLYNIMDAYDAATIKGVELSAEAKSAKRTYTSQTGKDFLEAAVAELRRLTGDNAMNLPVAYLSYLAPEVPMRRNGVSGQEVAFGLFVTNNGKSVSLPDASYYMTKVMNSLVIPNDRQYQKYLALTKGQKSALQMLGVRGLNEKLNEFDIAAREQSREKPRNQREMDKLRKEIEDEFAEEFESLSKEERDIRMSEEILSRQLASNSKGKTLKGAISLDLANTWLMIEAALSQNAVPVAEIRCPPMLRVELIKYAASNKRSQQIIDRFAAISRGNNLDRQIMFMLGCSVRDRFLGCGVRDEKTDAEVNARAKAMLAASSNLTNDDLLRVLKMIRNSGADRIYNELREFNKTADRKDTDIRLMLREIGDCQRVDVDMLPAMVERDETGSLDRDQGGERLLAPLLDIYLTPDSVRKLPGVLAGMDEADRRWLLRGFMIRRALQASDNPAVARYLNEFYADTDSTRFATEVSDVIVRHMNEMMADLFVYEIPDNLTSQSLATGYWQNIGVQSAGKSKDALIKEALARANLSLPNETLESVENIDVIAANMESLMKSKPVLAANLHRVAERTLGIRIPASRFGATRYWAVFENWWKINKSLYTPNRLVNSSDYNRYESYFGRREQLEALDAMNAPQAAGRRQMPNRPTVVPNNPTAKKPITNKGAKKQVNNTASVLLRSSDAPASSVPAPPPAPTKKPQKKNQGKKVDNTSSVLNPNH